MNIIFKGIAGSHLFGLNTEKSDRDFRGVYLPSKEDILLGKIKTSVKETTNPSNIKNTSEDNDTEYYSLDKFLRMLKEGQTVALEMLFTPKDKIVTSSNIWEMILSNRADLTHSGVNTFIGYAQTQAAKYGIRGSRMHAIKKTLEIINDYNPYDKMSTIWEDLKIKLSNTEHIEFIDVPFHKNNLDSMQEHISIIGKKFQKTMQIKQFSSTIQGIYDEYGKRTKEAMNNSNIDWKALSHAVRVIWQGNELLSTGNITLPLPEPIRTQILDIKLGKIPFIIAQKIIEDGMEELKKAEKSSILPKKLDNELINDIITKEYSNIVIKGYYNVI